MRAGLSWVEFFYQDKEKRKTLTGAKAELFWKQRYWHPGIQMAWLAEIDSNGEGMTQYPDGSKHFYQLTIWR